VGANSVKKHDFIELDYTGTTKEEGIIFDTTLADVAKKNHMNMDAEYKPVVICVGERHLVPGLDKNLEGAEVGKEYTYALTTEEAFGKKDAKLLQLIPTARFRKDNIMPMVGMQVNVDNSFGIVKTVSGGRTLVDFNHPLSGKDVNYRIKVHRILDNDEEKVFNLMQMQLGTKDMKVSVKDGKAEIEFAHDMPKEIVSIFEKKLTGIIPTVKELAFAKPASKDSKATDEESQEHNHSNEHGHDHSHGHSHDHNHEHHDHSHDEKHEH